MVEAVLTANNAWFFPIRKAIDLLETKIQFIGGGIMLAADKRLIAIKHLSVPVPMTHKTHLHGGGT